MRPQKYIVFTDLDGTLLDHETYSFAAALPAIEALQKHQIPIIPNTSKTAAEISVLQREIGLFDESVFENGGGMNVPKQAKLYSLLNKNASEFGAEDVGDSGYLLSFGAERSQVIEIIQKIRQQYGFNMVLLSEMSAQDMSDYTGLDLADAELSLQRLSAEPVVWKDSEANKETFCELVLAAGFKTQMGGRFIHVQGQVTKATAMTQVVGMYQKLYPDNEIVSVALGDAPNDLDMLEHADISIVIANPHSESLKITRNQNVFYEPKLGPEGWGAAMTKLMNQWFEQ